MNNTILYHKYRDLYDKLFASLKETLKVHNNAKMNVQLYTLITKLNYNTITSFNGARDDIYGLSSEDLIKSLLISNYTELNFDIDDLNKKTFELLKDKELLREKINNLCLRESTLNKCREDIINGVQFKCNRNSYQLGDDLYAVTDIGKKRTNQEDSVLILEHPKNNKYKLAVVADGIGGLNNGETASNYTNISILEWFENVNLLDFKNIKLLQQNLNNTIYSIDKDVKNKYPNAGTTLSIALICDNKTIISNVGDSRVYISKNGDFKQISIDQTLAEYLFKKGSFQENITRNDLKFMKESNMITSCIGEGPIYIDSTIIDNDSYDTLLLFSDGVTDCMMDDEIKVINISSKKEDIAKNIVHYALNNELHSNFNTIKGGKDNTSAVVYCKR